MPGLTRRMVEGPEAEGFTPYPTANVQRGSVTVTFLLGAHFWVRSNNTNPNKRHIQLDHWGWWGDQGTDLPFPPFIPYSCVSGSPTQS